MDGVAREKPLKKKDCVAREKEGVLRMVKGKFYLYFLNMWGIKERNEMESMAILKALWIYLFFFSLQVNCGK